MRIDKIKIHYLMIAIVLCYIPFHLFEEALGNFPAWMFQHRWMPTQLTYGHWMAGNVFFYYPLLVGGILLYRLGGKRFLWAGTGVLLWGVFNFLEHTIYTIIDSQVSPGFYTGFILLIIAILGIIRLHQMGKLTWRVMLPAFLIALVFAALPAGLQALMGPVFRGIFI